jgi:hypothetical protein
MDALGGGLKDAKNDREAGANTLAIFSGVKANKNLHIPLSYKIIILPFDISTIVLAIIPFLFFGFKYSLIQIFLIFLLIILLIFSTLKLLHFKVFDRKKIKYHNRNHELAGYVLVPVILMEIIGIKFVIFLIFFPIIWFIIFNYILYKDSWSNPKTF